MAVLAWMLAAAATAGTGVMPVESAELTASSSPRIDLHPLGEGCYSRASQDEILVCGNRDVDGKYRLRPIENGNSDGDKPLRLETGLGPDTIGVNNGQATVGGFSSNRMMIAIKIPF